MKRIILFLSLLLLLFTGCETSTKTPKPKSSDQIATAVQEENLKNAAMAVGQPDIVNYFEMKTYNWIYEMRDDPELISYAYFKSEYDGQLGAYLGQCIGLGYPASIQYNNPYKAIWKRIYGGSGAGIASAVLAQAEPNGLFSSSGLDATYVIFVHPITGKSFVSYFEDKVNISQIPLHVPGTLSLLEIGAGISEVSPVKK